MFFYWWLPIFNFRLSKTSHFLLPVRGFHHGRYWMPASLRVFWNIFESCRVSVCMHYYWGVNSSLCLGDFQLAVIFILRPHCFLKELFRSKGPKETLLFYRTQSIEKGRCNASNFFNLYFKVRTSFVCKFALCISEHVFTMWSYPLFMLIVMFVCYWQDLNAWIIHG